ncbi:MAG: TIR domain-containing protein [Candidatus Acidiferrales bacterium]
MDSPRKLVFLSYVEEDGDVAHAIAEGLEAKDYSTWYYERDCPTGADYFEETYRAISDCDAMIVLISPRSLPSDQITREIVRAVESSKATLPLLLEVSHDEYAKRRPGWKQAMAASNATRVAVDRIPTIIPALVAGLNAKGIRATNGLSTTNLKAPPADMIPLAADRITATPDSGAYTWQQTPSATQTASGSTTRVTPGSGVLTPPEQAPASDTGTHTPPTQTAAQYTPQTTTYTPPGTKPSGVSPAVMIGGLAALALVGVFVYKFTRPKPVPPPSPAPVTATVVLQYAPDRHNCTPEVNVTLGGKSIHPNAPSFAVSGLTPGPADYSVSGVVSCPGRAATKVVGSGSLAVKEGAVFAIGWQGHPGNFTAIDIHDAGAPPAGDSDEIKREPVNAVKTPSPKPPLNHNNAQVVPPANVAAGQQMFLNSQAALKQGHIFTPPVGSSLYWSIQSRAAGNEGGKEMEAQLIHLYSQQVSQYYTARNYPAALELCRELLVYYPASTGLQQDEARIQAAMNGSAPPPNGANPGQLFHQQLQQLQQMVPQQQPPPHH